MSEHTYTETWLKLADKPAYLNGHSSSGYRVAALDGKLYCPGGGYNVPNSQGGHTRGVLQTLAIYDIASDTWSHGADLPFPIANCGTAAVNGKIYCLCGARNGTYYDGVHIYDPSTDIWSAGTSCPVKFAPQRALAIGNKIYCMQNDYGTNLAYPMYIYDTASDTWEKGAEYPESNASFYVHVASGQKIHRICHNRHDIFDTQTEQWTQAASIGITAYVLFPTGACLGNKIYILGTPYNNAYRFTYVYDMETDMWEELGPLPANLYAFVDTVAYQDKIYCVGGYQNYSWSTGSTKGVYIAVYSYSYGQVSVTHNITHRYHTSEGAELWPDERYAISDGEAHIAKAQDIEGWRCIGYTLDDGPVQQGDTATLPSVQADCVITFLYEQITFAVTVEHRDEDGAELRSNEVSSVIFGEAFLAAALDIDGYTCIGHSLDGSALLVGDRIRLEDIRGDHIVTFVYHKDEEQSCCCPMSVNIPLCSCYEELLPIIRDFLEKKGMQCSCQKHQIKLQ